MSVTNVDSQRIVKIPSGVPVVISSVISSFTHRFPTVMKSCSHALTDDTITPIGARIRRFPSSLLASAAVIILATARMRASFLSALRFAAKTDIPFLILTMLSRNGRAQKTISRFHKTAFPLTKAKKIFHIGRIAHLSPRKKAPFFASWMNGDPDKHRLSG